MKIKNILRLLILLFMIGLACVLPVPISFFRKDDLPKNLIEQLDKKDEKAEEDEIKEQF